MFSEHLTFLYTATPPRGTFDSIFSDRPSNIKPSGHFIRILKCVSLSKTMSNFLRNVFVSSSRNLFLTPLMFHDKILKELVLPAVSEKTNFGQRRFHQSLTFRF